MGSSANREVPRYLVATAAGSEVLLIMAFRNSRILFRTRILRDRFRPNLALSPFLCDIISSRANYGNFEGC
jgi:hypothetical protein